MTKFYSHFNISRAEPQKFTLTAATTTPAFTAGTFTFVWYNSAAVAGTLQCTFDGGANWFTVATATAKSNCSVFDATDFAGYEALATKAGAFRVSFGAAFTGTVIVEAILV